MKKKTTRILVTAAAIAGGVCIVLLLALAGERGKGPVENLLSSAGEFIQSIEDRIFLGRREKRRIRRLDWFEPYRTQVALLKQPEIILMGASDSYVKDSFEPVLNLEDSLGLTFPLIHIYNAWGSGSEHAFPELQAQTIVRLGSVPVITWEPWLSSFDEKKYPDIPPVEERDLGSLSAIAEGTYDRYIKEWAQDVAAFDAPIFLRLGHEMNDPYRYPWGPQNNKPHEFVDAWVHVHEIFQAEGADKVLWVWSPHPSYGYFDAFYPGEAYVDYIGLGVLNFGTVANWSQWWSFDDILEKHYPVLDSFNKPMIVTEFGCLNVGGDRAEWYRDAFNKLPVKYPSIKSVVFFHYSEDKTVTNKVVSWQIIRDSAALGAIREEIAAWPDSLKPQK